MKDNHINRNLELELQDNKTQKQIYKLWTYEEDLKLIELVNKKDSLIKWNEIAVNFNKTVRQCYSRYKQINPNLNKGKWTLEEEDNLKKLVDKYGKKWSQLSKHLKTRSSKQIRDHFNNCMDNTISKEKFSKEEIDKIKCLYMKFGPKWSHISKFFVGRTGDSIKNKYYWSIKSSHSNDEIEILTSKININHNFDLLNYL